MGELDGFVAGERDCWVESWRVSYEHWYILLV